MVTRMIKYLKTTSHEEQVKGPKEFRLDNKKPRGHAMVFYSVRSKIEERMPVTWAATKHTVQINMRKTYQSTF